MESNALNRRLRNFRNTAARRNPIALAVFLAFFLAAPSPASTITYLYEGSASGTLDGVPFSTRTFRISCVGESDERHAFEHEATTGFYIDNVSASIQIQGWGTMMFTTATRVFVNNTTNLVGFSRIGEVTEDLYDGPQHADFATWNMLTPIGPNTGYALVLVWNLVPPIMTSEGVLVLNYGETVGTFQAFVDATPCPGDVDANGVVDFDDVLQLLYDWGPCTRCPSDINASGAVDFADLVLLLESWGECS